MSAAVEWSQLRDAYGPADAVPGFLADLESADHEVRATAIDELWSRLCHQGTVYSASGAAVPFVVSAARAVRPESPELLQMLVLVVEIGRGFDGTWEGYTQRSCVEGARDAVAAEVPGLVDWARRDGSGLLLAAVVALAGYFPAALESVRGCDALDEAVDPRLVAARDLAVLAGGDVGVSGEDCLRAAALDAEVLDFAEQTAEGMTVEALARAVIVELALATMTTADE